MALLHRQPPRLGDLVRVGPPDHIEARDRPQRREVLDRLAGLAASLSPLESWVKMWITGSSINAESRIACRA